MHFWNVRLLPSSHHHSQGNIHNESSAYDPFHSPCLVSSIIMTNVILGATTLICVHNMEDSVNLMMSIIRSVFIAVLMVISYWVLVFVVTMASLHLPFVLNNHFVLTTANISVMTVFKELFEFKCVSFDDSMLLGIFALISFWLGTRNTCSHSLVLPGNTRWLKR